jgi:FtsH-binding integral membrane protein
MNALFGLGKKVFQLVLQKKEFVGLVFLNLMVQLGITYKTAMETTSPFHKYFWPTVTVIFTLTLIMSYSAHPAIKFVLFVLLSYAFGTLISSIKNTHNQKDIQVAMESTLAIFASMFITAVVLLIGGVKLGYTFGLFLFCSLVGLIVYRLIWLYSGVNGHSVVHILGVLLFSMYVMYDTNVILQKDTQMDVISASFSYYLDVLNLFQDLLNS